MKNDLQGALQISTFGLWFGLLETLQTMCAIVVKLPQI